MNKLAESPYYIAVGDLVLFFNTEKALYRFIEERDDVLKETSAKISKIYKDLFTIDMNVLSDVRLYYKINRRGFLVKHKGVSYNSLDEMKFELNNISKI